MLGAKLRITGIMLLVLGIAFGFAGCASVKEAAQAVIGSPQPEGAICANSVKVQVADEAALEGFECSFKKFDGVKSLWFKVTLRNISKEDQRYKVNIFLDSGKAVGGLIPRTTKKGLMKPGATASFSYPAKGQDTKPKEVTLIVKTMSK